ncbi:MAG: hypothetical protein ABEH61_03935 [Haloarculaceae archaeon]
MGEIGFRQLSLLLTGVAMIAVGVLGLAGVLSDGPLLIGAMFVAVSLLSFDIGRMYDEHRPG